jgi:hypothetical protein
MPSPKDFIAQYGSQVFNHSDVLLEGLRDGSIHFDSASTESRQLNRAYLDIYQFRLEHLRKTSSSDHGRAIAADVEDLCVHLAEHPESPCDLWIFLQNPHLSYLVFVTRDCGLVAGCIRGVDARLLSEPELAQLWGRQ